VAHTHVWARGDRARASARERATRTERERLRRHGLGAAAGVGLGASGIVERIRAMFGSAPVRKHGAAVQPFRPLGLLLLLLLGALPHTGAPGAGSAREQRNAIECEACNWVVEQLDEVRVLAILFALSCGCMQHPCCLLQHIVESAAWTVATVAARVSCPV
jgi:hypothetical protein